MSEVSTSGTDLLVIAFRALAPEEQEDVLTRCYSIWLKGQEEAGSETARMLASLRRVAELLGETPGIEDYKRVRSELQAEGEELEPASRITKHFGGSWHQAKEALDLSKVSTPRRIEERFRKRRLGKVWRYSEDDLRDTIRRAVSDIGHVPQVAAFDWWRQRQIELATAQGEDPHLPSAGPYRRRFGSWEKALLHFGFTPDEVAERLERGSS